MEIQAASCSSADVQAAVDKAAHGDTVSVPAGECEWTEGVVILAGITLRGAGIGATAIRENLPSNGSLITLLTEAGKPYRLTGFGIANGSDRTRVYGAGTVAVMGDSASIRLDHNKWDRVMSRHVRTNGYVRGVSDHNVHITDLGSAQIYHLWHAEWAGGDYGDGSWTEDIDWGGPDAWYIEDSYIEGVGVFATVIDTFAGARVVVRYNALRNANLPTHGTGDGAGIRRGLRHFEIYGNEIAYDPPSALNTAHIRGGTGIYCGNIHHGVSKAVTLHYYRVGRRSDGGGFGRADGTNPIDGNDPKVYESGAAGPGSGDNALVVPGAGWTVDQWRGFIVRVPESSIHPDGLFSSVVMSNDAETIKVRPPNFPKNNPHTFVEGEAFEIRRIPVGLDMTGAGTSGPMHREPDGTPIQGEMNQRIDPVYIWGNELNGNYPQGHGGDNLFEDVHWMVEKNPYDGSSGVGVGALADRPPNPTLLRTAYFASDDETLYVWDGSEWQEKWTAYQYPHPLIGGEAQDPIEPDPDPIEPEPDPVDPDPDPVEPDPDPVEPEDPVAKPDPPTGLVISEKGANAELMWDGSLVAIDFYRVWRKPAAGSLMKPHATTVVPFFSESHPGRWGPWHYGVSVVIGGVESDISCCVVYRGK